jgi:glycosyltransferase 2 family protein
LQTAKLDVPARRTPLGYWAAAAALAGALLYFSLRGIDWPRVWAILKGAHPLPLLLAFVSITLAVFLRSVRWRVLLSAEGGAPAPLVFWATAAGYLGNNLLPARAGELVRTLMVSERAGLSRAFVLTTALSERVADALALIGIGAGVLLTLPQPPGWLARAARPVGALGLCGAAAIALLPFLETVALRLLARLPLPERAIGIAARLLTQITGGMRSFHNPARLARFLALTAVIWSMDAMTAMLCARAASLPLTLPLAFLLLAGLGLGSALPATPGYVGIFQFVAVSLLVPFGFSSADAVACVLVLQAANYAVILLWGSIGVARNRRAKEKAAVPA